MECSALNKPSAYLPFRPTSAKDILCEALGLVGYFVIFIHLEIQDLKNKDLEIITSCYFISFLSSQLFVYDLIYYDIFMLCSFGFALYIFWGFPRGCHPDPVGDSARFA